MGSGFGGFEAFFVGGDVGGDIGGFTSFTEAAGAVPIVQTVSPDELTVTDSDSATLASATAVITNLQDGAAESIGVTCPDAGPGCSGAILLADVAYTPATGTLAIARVAPLADYQALLRTLTYNNSSQNPGTTPRDITVTVNDGIFDNAPVAHALVTVTAVNTAPVLANLPKNQDLTYSTDFRQIYANVLDKWLESPAQKILGQTYKPLGFV